MASGGLSGMETGENVIIGGLVVQILFFTCFVVTAGIFHARLIRVPTGKSMQVHSLWTRSLYSLYAGSVLIWVRCVFRLIEYAQGTSWTYVRWMCLTKADWCDCRQRRLSHLARSLPLHLRCASDVPGHGDLRRCPSLRDQRAAPRPWCEEDREGCFRLFNGLRAEGLARTTPFPYHGVPFVLTSISTFHLVQKTDFSTE